MKKVPLVLLAFVTGAFAQAPTGTPAKSAFAGFGNALDQRPPSMRMAKTPVPVSQLSKPTSLTFDVRSVANGGGADAFTPAGAVAANSTSRKRESQTYLELTVHNLSVQPGSAQFDWYFLAKNVAKTGPYVWDRGSKQIAVGAGGEIKETLQSSELAETTTVSTERHWVAPTGGSSGYYENVSVSRKEGARPVGWIVRMFVDGKVAKVVASSAEFQQMGLDATFGSQ